MRKSWLNKEDVFIANNMDKPVKFIGKALNRSLSSVKGRIRRLKLKRLPLYPLNDQHDNFLLKFYENKGAAFCAKSLELPVYKIRERAAQLNLKIQGYFWSKAEDNFLFENYVKYGRRYCAEHLKRTPHSISVRACFLKIPDRMFKNLSRDIHVEKFLNPNSPESAYLLGLLWADGSVSKKQNQISISLVKEDADFLKPIILSFGDWHVNEKYYNSCSQKPQIKFCFSNKVVSDFLKSLGFCEKSGGSAQRVLDVIPLHLHNFFWLGLTDGDGCFTYSGHSPEFSITSTFDQEWDFAFYLKDYLTLKNLKFIKKEIKVKDSDKIRRASRMTLLTFYDIKRYGMFIYQDKLNNNSVLGLNRKFEKWEYIVDNFKPHRNKGNMFGGISNPKKCYYIDFVLDGTHYRKGKIYNWEEAVETKRQMVIETDGVARTEEYGFYVPYINGIVCTDPSLVPPYSEINYPPT